VTAPTPAQTVEMIPVDRVIVINPRTRNKKVFNEIVESIAMIGLKRPITVTREGTGDDSVFHLVCGQGRLEACRILGHSEVPALIVTADEEDCLVSSIVENCARRQHRAMDILRDIGEMRNRGFAVAEIARKTGLSYEYVHGVTRLLEHGEERLLRAVESGSLPISVAVDISEAGDGDMREALQAAYNNNLLRGRKLEAARRLVEARRRKGKGLLAPSRSAKKPVSPQALVRAFEEDSQRKRDLVKRCELAKARLTFVTEAIRCLIDDDGFFAILEEEDLMTVPSNLAKRIPELSGEPA
jgi:ParB family transcriptional regulator, chromosome partitioning protein